MNLSPQELLQFVRALNPEQCQLTRYVGRIADAIRAGRVPYANWADLSETNRRNMAATIPTPEGDVYLCATDDFVTFIGFEDNTPDFVKAYIDRCIDARGRLIAAQAILSYRAQIAILCQNDEEGDTVQARYSPEKGFVLHLVDSSAKWGFSCGDLQTAFDQNDATVVGLARKAREFEKQQLK